MVTASITHTSTSINPLYSKSREPLAIFYHSCLISLFVSTENLLPKALRLHCPSAAGQTAAAAVGSSITGTQVALQLSISLPDWAISTALRLLLVRAQCKTLTTDIAHNALLFLILSTKQTLTLVGFCCICQNCMYGCVW